MKTKPLVVSRGRQGFAGLRGRDLAGKVALPFVMENSQLGRVAGWLAPLKKKGISCQIWKQKPPGSYWIPPSFFYSWCQGIITKTLGGLESSPLLFKKGNITIIITHFLDTRHCSKTCICVYTYTIAILTPQQLYEIDTVFIHFTSENTEGWSICVMRPRSKF